jgi:oligopeptide transport system substrate-binding protein
MRSKWFVVASMLIVASMLLGACNAGAGAADPSKVLHLNFGPGDIPTLDPALGTDTSSIQIAIETFVGLTRADEVTNIVAPGMAKSWDIDATGTIYTFHLRDDVPWVKYNPETAKVEKVKGCDGKVRMVNANDFAYGMLRTLNPVTASDYAYVLGFALVGGNEYNAGEAGPEAVGVKVVDNTTLELTFKEAAAYNAAIAGMWVGYAQPKWIIEGDECTTALGDRWTETGNFEGYGPFAMKEWVHDSDITLIANPFWPGTTEVPQSKISEVNWVFLDESPAFAEYEAGNLDVVPAPLADLDRIKTDPVLSKEFKISPYFCTYYYGFNTTAPFTDDVRVRRALSMAIDRQSLIDNVTKGEQTPAQWFSRPGLAGAPTLEDHPDLGVKTDPAAAKASLQEYLDEKGITAADVDITLMYNTSEGHQKIAEAIQQMWKDTLGIDVKVVNQEWQVFLDTIRSADTPQVYRLGWCLDYADANNFIREVFVLGGSANPSDPNDPTKPFGGVTWFNPTFEAKVLEAAKELDPAKRVEMYAEAENILVWEDAVMAPIYWYTKLDLTKPYVTRTWATGGHEHIEKWDIDTAAK